MERCSSFVVFCIDISAFLDQEAYCRCYLVADSDCGMERCQIGVSSCLDISAMLN
jgi:hypothetical protein